MSTPSETPISTPSDRPMPSESAGKAVRPTCPRCGYDQSGEVARWTESCPVKGTCPECGLEFVWEKLMSAFPPPAWSYEHSSIFSVHAMIGSLLRLRTPARFFRGLHIAVKPRPFRLVAVVLLAFLGATIAKTAAFWWLIFVDGTLFKPVVHSSTGLEWRYLTAAAEFPFAGWASESRPDLAFAPVWFTASLLIVVLIPVLLFGMVASRRTCRVKSAHLCRAALPATLVLCLLPLLFVAEVVLYKLFRISFPTDMFGFGPSLDHWPSSVDLGLLLLLILWLARWWHVVIFRFIAFPNARAIWRVAVVIMTLSTLFAILYSSKLGTAFLLWSV